MKNKKKLLITAYIVSCLSALVWLSISIIIFFLKATPKTEWYQVINLVWSLSIFVFTQIYIKVPISEWFLHVETINDLKLIEREKCAIIISAFSFMIWIGSLMYTAYQCWVVEKTQIPPLYLEILMQSTFLVMVNTILAYVVRMQYKVICFKENNNCK